MRSIWQRAAAGLVVFSISSFAAPPAVELAKFTGLSSCQSSGCHGGGAGSDQCAVWASVDFHVRAFAILLTPRSTAIVDAMHRANPAASMANPTVNPNCTTCHSPFAEVETNSPARLMPSAHGDEGVSCESCHGPASNWLRSHTRTDYTTAQRVASGMTDLRSAYGRANTCVACHEYLSPDIAHAGHPELIFELDSQAVSEPPHWKETDPWMGLHSWLAGQAVAFRENTWHVLKVNDTPGASSRWEALGWLLDQTTSNLKELPAFSLPQGTLTGKELGDLEMDSDKLARSAADFPWTTDDAERLLKSLASTGPAIQQVKGVDGQAHRAEVLVQAMDRLLVELHAHQVEFPGSAQKLDGLFADVRVPDNFDASNFVQDLGKFSNSLGKP